VTGAGGDAQTEEFLDLDDIDDADLATIDLRHKVLLLTSDPAVAAGMKDKMERFGLAVSVWPTLEKLHETVDQVLPEVVVIDERLAGNTAREAILSLRSRGATFAIPIVTLLSDASINNLLYWLHAGAVDAWAWPLNIEPADRSRNLAKECSETNVQQTMLRPRLLAYAKRSQLTGTLITNGGTPFEGRATFISGDFSEAQFGMLTGAAAVDRMLELDDGPIQWQEAQSTGLDIAQTLHRPTYRARILLVGADNPSQAALAQQLRNTGHVVDVVRGGAVGVQAALRTPYDVIVLDFQLPRLEAWAVLREVRMDRVAREAAVIATSQHEEILESLKAAQAGAHSYFSRSTQPRIVYETIEQIISPRNDVWNSVVAKQATTISLGAVGTVWLLRTLGELDCTGRLVVEDGKGRFEMAMTQGQLVSVASMGGTLKLRGSIAFEALIASSGEAKFTFESIDVLERAPWLFDALDTACDNLRRKERKKLSDAMANPSRLNVNQALLPLFKLIATPDELKVIAASKQYPDNLNGLVGATGLEPPIVQQVIPELMRWGVLTND
jgi:DNA-binding response OmpR family regulator